MRSMSFKKPLLDPFGESSVSDDDAKHGVRDDGVVDSPCATTSSGRYMGSVMYRGGAPG